MLVNDSIINSKETSEAGFFTKAICGLIDAALVLLVVSLLLIYQKPVFIYQYLSSINSTLLVFICLIIYRFSMMLFFDGTIGMKLAGVVFLDADQQPLSIKEKILVGFFILYNGVAYYKNRSGHL